MSRNRAQVVAFTTAASLMIALDLAALDYDPLLDETTRKQLIDARIGQGIYRQQLEKLWGGKCAVLGIINRQQLIARFSGVIAY